MSPGDPVIEIRIYDLDGRDVCGLTPLEEACAGRGRRRARATATASAQESLVAGILWTPAKALVLPGDFEVSTDPERAAEAACLREASASRGRR